MDKEEIKDYLKRVDELEAKLTGEDKETLEWLIFGYNQCAKLLEENEQQCKKQKEVIDNVINIINQHFKHHPELLTENQIEYELIRKIENILKEVSE